MLSTTIWYYRNMTEQEAKAILENGYDKEDVERHLEHIKSMGQGKWIELEAKKYLEELKSEEKN